MNYLIPAYIIILAGIVGYQILLFVRAKKLEAFLEEYTKKTGE